MYIAVVKCVLIAVHMLQKCPLILLLCAHRIVTFNVEIHQNEDIFWKSCLLLQGKPRDDLNAAPWCLPHDLKLENRDNHTVCIKMPVSTFYFFAFSLAVPSSGLPSEALSPCQLIYLASHIWDPLCISAFPPKVHRKRQDIRSLAGCRPKRTVLLVINFSDIQWCLFWQNIM